VVDLVRAAAPVDTPVLLLGESGTGKGELARLLHRLSPRAEGPFVQVNCAAVPVDLFESEFFGHRRGAFTGATTDREGRFRVAHGGTLLLDEIDTLPPPAQAKVLRVLEDGVFERLGESRPTTVDVRLVSASNAELAAAVARGAFRADLFYRINVVTVHIPPLRERRDDIPLLARAFLAEVGARLGKPLHGFADETLEALLGYPWPGNVRELKNVIERGVLLESSDRLTPESLPFDPPAGAGSAAGGAGDLHLRRSLQQAERRILKEALERSDGVKREAARLLGIDERNLSYFLRKNGLTGEDPR
jgi:transcriptional regulator with PAS, ATPase and Fis domain